MAYTQAQLNQMVQQAQAKGIDPARIQNALRNTIARQGQAPAQQPHQRNLIAQLAPLLGSIGGGVVGSVVAPGFGTAAGGAAGGALGEALAERLSGENYNAGNILREGAFGSLGGLGEAFQAARGAGTVAKAAKVGSGLAKVAKAAPLAEEAAARTLSSAFPVGKALSREVNPIQTAKDILKYNIKNGAGTASDWQKVIDSVTGSNGLLSKSVRETVGNIKSPINLDNVQKSFRNILETTSGLDEATVVRERNILSRLIGPNLGKMNATDAFDVMRKIESKVADLRMQAGKNIVNRSDYGALAKAYQAAKEEIMNSFEQAAAKTGAKAIVSPEALSKLSKISPQLAQEAANAKSFAELRKIQSPFVRLGKMINESSAEGILPNAGRQLASNLVGTGVGSAMGGIPGAVIGSALSPVIETGFNAARTPVMTQLSKLLQKSGSLPSLPPAIGTAARVGAGQVAGNAVFGNGQPQQPQDQSMMYQQPQMQDYGQMQGQQSGQQDQQQQQLFLAAMLSDLQRTGGKNIAKIQAVAQFAGAGKAKQSKLSDTAIKQVSDTQNAIQSLGNLQGVLGNTTGFNIPGVGYRVTLPTEETKITQAQIDRVRQMVGKALEGGKLTDSDYAKYEKILPTIHDAPNVAQAKIQSLIQALQNQLQSYTSLQNSRGSGQFQDPYSSMVSGLNSSLSGY